MSTCVNTRANGYAISRDLNPTPTSVELLKPLGRETRKHSQEQLRKLARSLDEFGFVLPVVTDEHQRVVAGWGLVLAARKLGLSEVPTVRLSGLSEAQLRTLRIALNKLGDESEWALDVLKLEFEDILELEPSIELELSGFDMGKIDLLLGNEVEDEDPVPELDQTSEPRTRPGDLWALGEHRILCGDALKPESYATVLGDARADIMFSDPPYNLPIGGHVSGLGQVKHEEFAMASGEMSGQEFTQFLQAFAALAAAHSKDGAIHYICMDWRHLEELIAAGKAVYSDLKNICVWNKTNAGMGSLYRSKHELVMVFKVGSAPHTNNVALGRHGRHRSNVWDYPGATIVTRDRQKMLEAHPTVKPVRLIADALLDCSRQGEVVLDPFGGSGSTLIAAEKAGRKAALIELEPRFVDVTLERWSKLTGREPQLVARQHPSQ